MSQTEETDAIECTPPEIAEPETAEAMVQDLLLSKSRQLYERAHRLFAECQMAEWKEKTKATLFSENVQFF